ncbi:MAG: hypothetical protein EBU46_01795 [Nitrosomonadaceae bacterium]|nr:hypothetical protein [Nitrosomonadaceae bacterium]
MNRRECLKALAALGASLSLPLLAIESANQKDIDTVWLELQSAGNHGLADHPRIVLLRNNVLDLPVDTEYKAHLLNSIDLYRDHIINRPMYAPNEGWDDLEAIQQVTLGDMNERWFREQQAIQIYREKKSIEDFTFAEIESFEPREQYEINREYISLYLSRCDCLRDTIDFETHDGWPSYPRAKIDGMAAGAVYWQSNLEIDKKSTKEEILAKVVRGAMNRKLTFRGGRVQWSESETTKVVKATHPFFKTSSYRPPFMKTFNCNLYYSETTAKEDLIKNAINIMNTWCPSVHVVLSDQEIIHPLEYMLQQALLSRNK